MLRSLEVCAGAGGQALGIQEAEFFHEALVEVDPKACETLRANFSDCDVIEADLTQFDARRYRGIDLFAGEFPARLLVSLASS